MKRENLRTYMFPAILALLLTALTVESLPAQNFGRLLMVVKDAQGKPVPGVTVSATCDELPKFNIQKLTDKKGKATLAFGDATKTYNVKVEYEGYPPIEMPFKPEIRKSITQEVSLVAASDAEGGQTAKQGTIIYTPAERIFNEGVEAARGGDYEAARAKFLAALGKNPDFALAHSALGGLHAELGEHDSAIASAQRLLELEPDNPRGYRILYDVYTALGKKDLAKKALANMVSADDTGDAAILLYNEGVAALEVGDAETAKRRFREALDVNPELTPALSALAVTLMKEESFEEAAQTAERLLVVEPDNLKAKGLAYDAYKAMGNSEGEAMAFQRLAGADPTAIGRTMYDRGVQLFGAGSINEALDSLEKALAADPSLSKAHYFLGLCFANRGDEAGAREHLERFVEMAPDDPDAAGAAEMAKALSGG